MEIKVEVKEEEAEHPSEVTEPKLSEGSSVASESFAEQLLKFILIL